MSKQLEEFILENERISRKLYDRDLAAGRAKDKNTQVIRRAENDLREKSHSPVRYKPNRETCQCWLIYLCLIIINCLLYFKEIILMGGTESCQKVILAFSKIPEPVLIKEPDAIHVYHIDPVLQPL